MSESVRQDIESILKEIARETVERKKDTYSWLKDLYPNWPEDLQRCRGLQFP